jgi:hypothetical protein
MLTRVVTFTVGDRPDLVVRTHLALVSALAWAPAGCEIALVTDRPDLYGWFAGRIRLLPVGTATLDEWKGPHQDFWRSKLMAVRHAAAQGPAHLLYVDSDTLTRRPLHEMVASLEAGDVFLHAHERDLARGTRRGDRRMWRDLNGRTAAGFTFTAPCHMWNAGVIGLPAARRDRLERALALYDGLASTGFRDWLTEQLSLSVSLHETGRLRAAAPWITHYWGNKDGYLPDLEAQLGLFRRTMDPEAAAAHVRANPVEHPVLVRRRWWSRLLGRRLARRR